MNNHLLCLSHAKENIIIFETTQANNCLFERFKKKNLRLFYLKCCEGRYPLQLGKGIDPPTSKEAPGSQGFSLGGVWGGGSKKGPSNILIVDMDGEKSSSLLQVFI